MGIALLLFAQAATTMSEDSSKFDLRTMKPSKTCAAASGDIVVCGTRDPDRYRLKPIANAYRYEPKPLKAAVDPGKGVSATSDTQAGRLGDPQLMVHLNIKF